MTTKSRPTMADVANEVGVSLMTVSRVVNNKGDVSPTTRKQVLAAIKRLNYRPSGIARGLATKQTGTLGVVVPDSANPFFSELAKAAEQAAYEAGYNVFLCNTDEDIERELGVLQSLDDKQIDGLLLCSSRLNETLLGQVAARFKATVLVNRRLPNRETCAVLIDDTNGAALATRHLLESGRRAIAFLSGPENSRSAQCRLSGYRHSLQQANLRYNPTHVVPCPPTVDGGSVAARSLLQNQPNLDALFCYNDLVAVGALQVCREMGLNVPQDISVVGCDDIMLAALVNPPLSTCSVSRLEVGTTAMGLLLQQISANQPACREIIIQPDFIIRESSNFSIR